MQRIEEFTVEGNNFIYLNLSEMKTNDEFIEMAEATKAIISKYPKKSLYAIININDIRFDSETKVFLVDYMAYNKPYVKRGAVVGFESIKKMIMIHSICDMDEGAKMLFTFTKETAVELLLRKE